MYKKNLNAHRWRKNEEINRFLTSAVDVGEFTWGKFSLMKIFVKIFKCNFNERISYSTDKAKASRSSADSFEVEAAAESSPAVLHQEA